MGTRLRLGFIALVAASAADHAAAQSITRQFDFAAYNLSNPFDPSLVSPDGIVAGSILVTFDKSKAANNQTSGISLIGLNIKLGSQIAFSYQPAWDLMVIGGEQAGTTGAFANTDDFTLSFFSASSTPMWGSFFYYQVTNGNTVFESWNDDVVVTGSTISPAPEPANWAMMVGGFGLVGGAMRSRRKTAVAFS